MKANKKLTNLSEFIDQEHGPDGTKERQEFEAGYAAFKLAAMLQQARRQNALTQLRRRYDELDRAPPSG